MGFELLKEKVPEFKNSWNAFFIFLIWFALSLLCIAFFLWFDKLVWYGALISQLIVALTCSAFLYGHMKNAKKYRQKYGKMAYRKFFFHFIMPILATWYALTLHPLLVGGPRLLPLWLSIIIGIFLFSFRPLTARYVSRAGFDINYGLGIYSVFPEEGTRISSEIYSYVRHPLYLGSLCAAFGFAFLRGNLLALCCALIFAIPIFSEVKLEDREMIERFGQEHRKYIKETGAIFPPLEKTGKFLKFLFFKD